jgi:hypothetical protein
MMLVNMRLASRSGPKILSPSVFHGWMVKRLVKSMTSMSASATRYCIYCCRRSISECHTTMWCRHPRSSKIKNGASGTTPPHTIPMSVGCSSCIFNWPLNKSGSNSMTQRGQWRLMKIPFLWTWLEDQSTTLIEKYQKSRKEKTEPIKGLSSIPSGAVPSSSTIGTRAWCFHQLTCVHSVPIQGGV